MYAAGDIVSISVIWPNQIQVLYGIWLIIYICQHFIRSTKLFLLSQWNSSKIVPKHRDGLEFLFIWTEKTVLVSTDNGLSKIADNIHEKLILVRTFSTTFSIEVSYSLLSGSLCKNQAVGETWFKNKYHFKSLMWLFAPPESRKKQDYP